MATDLKRIGERARKQPEVVFTSLYHHVTDVDNLRRCYHLLDNDKATGVDGVTKQQYGQNLEDNLQELSGRLKRMGYRPQPSRRSYIPKPGSDQKRPLGISSFEDKLVELSVKQTLEPIYEEAFEDVSYGYRPGRSQHQCLDALGRTIQQKRVSFIVEADIKGFFDNVSHSWMIKFLEHRIGDHRVIRLVTRCPPFCPTFICTTCWTCGFADESGSRVVARHIIFVLPTIVCHEHTQYIVVEKCATAQEMRVGPSEPACRSRLQTTSSCCGQEPWW